MVNEPKEVMRIIVWLYLYRITTLPQILDWILFQFTPLLVLMEIYRGFIDNLQRKKYGT
jgi:uncharacterized membrane protein (DUF373 family)